VAFRNANVGNLVACRWPVLAILQTPATRAADQGLALALRRHFEGQIAACGLSAPRAKLKNRINTFLSSPLCRGVDELCAVEYQRLEKLLEETDATWRSSGEATKQCFYLLKENARLVRRTTGVIR
jgi:hypothetical protein